MIYLICGLPCSGKTYLANKMIMESKNKNILFDDINNTEDGVQRLKQYAIEGYDCYVTDPDFCITEIREKCEDILKGFDFSWIFFENNLYKCIANYYYRNDGRAVLSYINFLSARYIIPFGVDVRKIWQYEKSNN